MQRPIVAPWFVNVDRLTRPSNAYGLDCDRSLALQGYASEIYGSGDNIRHNFPGNLNVQVINTNRVQVIGAGNEEWIRVKQTVCKLLARLQTCGRYFAA